MPSRGRELGSDGGAGRENGNDDGRQAEHEPGPAAHGASRRHVGQSDVRAVGNSVVALPRVELSCVLSIRLPPARTATQWRLRSRGVRPLRPVGIVPISKKRLCSN